MPKRESLSRPKRFIKTFLINTQILKQQLSAIMLYQKKRCLTLKTAKLLRKIPYLGKSLFSPKSEEYEPSELLIFIRARIFKQGAKDDFTEPSKIDIMMDKNYVPEFRSPNTGKSLMPEVVEFEKMKFEKTFSLDQPSKKPTFE